MIFNQNKSSTMRRKLTCKKILPTFSSSLLPEVTMTQKRKLVSGWLGTHSEDPSLAGCCSRSCVGVSMRKAMCAFREVSMLRDKEGNCCPADSDAEREAAAGPSSLCGPKTPLPY